MTADPVADIRSAALAQGFDAVGFAPARQSEDARAALAAFLEAGFHGDMGWLEARRHERADPRNLWPEARSAIVLGHSYAPATDPLHALEDGGRGVISVYAQGKDYHDVMKPRLKHVARHIAARFGAGVKVFVDTAPLMEKPLAQAAGLGWQGKHTNLVSRDHGSWLFLGVILTTLDLAPDAAMEDHCGTCSRCLDACPTSAFVAPYRLDARRCISYLTIEHKTAIDRDLRPLMGNRIYGCDDCLAVCPWNKFAAATAEQAYQSRDAATSNDLQILLLLDDAAFRDRFRRSPVKRIGRDRFLRNVLVAAGNSGDRSLVPVVTQLLEDPAALVRGCAVWALSRLCTDTEWAALARTHQPREQDPGVLEEWRAVSGSS
ncbi:MAG: tRNA epoxyqueuosine(34) reductase QueG [Alphaproteobacteria bacterium]|jgi:epoxyqueuosine reductase